MGGPSIAMETEEEYSEGRHEDGEMVVLKNSVIELKVPIIQLKLPKSELDKNNIETIYTITKDIYQNYYLYGKNTNNKSIIAIVYKAKLRHFFEWPANYWRIYAHKKKSFTLWSMSMDKKPKESSIEGGLMEAVTHILPLLMHVEKTKEGEIALYGMNFKGDWGMIWIDKSAVSAFENELEDVLLFDKRI